MKLAAEFFRDVRNALWPVNRTPFVTGDVVAEGDGAPMTVVGIRGDAVRCAWGVEGGYLRFGTFRSESISLTDRRTPLSLFTATAGQTTTSPRRTRSGALDDG